MRASISAGVAGVLFAAGLALGGMTQPSKVIGFLDFFGDWDPSLVFVMGGAIAVHSLLFSFVSKRARSFFAGGLSLPTRRDLDPPLLLGAALFGIGWGLGGFCPGPGLVALPTLGAEALVFVGSMTLGIVAFDRLRGTAPHPAATNDC